MLMDGSNIQQFRAGEAGKQGSKTDAVIFIYAKIRTIKAIKVKKG